MAIIHWIGIDDHADKWTVEHLEGEGEQPKNSFELMPSEQGYRKLIGFLKGLKGEVRVAYEAGPCGYELYRRLDKSGIWCRVAAPSLTPRKPGERIKTNRRDARKIARYLRSGELTWITVPDRNQESLRDLTRARSAAQKDLVRVRHQISKMLLRNGHRFREGRAWTQRFNKWLMGIKLDGDSQFVLDELLVTHEHQLERVQRFDQRIEAASAREQYVPYLNVLRTLRGVDTLTAMTILAELGDLRRYATATQLMAAIGLVPSEYSTGDSTNRYGITKTGNAHVRHVVIEAAWQYQRRPRAGRTIRARRKNARQEVVAIAEKCELRLHRKFARMTSRNKRSTVAAVAVGRELVGFIWALGQLEHP